MRKELFFLKAHHQTALLETFSQLSSTEQDLFLADLQSFNEELLAAQQQRWKEKQLPLTFFPWTDYEPKGNLLYKNQGMAMQNHSAGVILAGGMGSRLGSALPKGCINILGKSLFEHHLEKCPERYPVIIMVSSHNQEETQKFLKAHHNFEREIHFIVQPDLPFLTQEGNWFPDEKGFICRGPCGNGALLDALFKSPVALTLKERGIKWINIIPVDNPLALLFDPELIGMASSCQLDAAIKAIWKKPSESLGLIGKKEGSPILYEYTEYPTKERKNLLGNISQFCFSFEFLFKVFENTTQKKLPWHLSFKEVKQARGHPWAWKFETFLFDCLKETKKVKILLYPREECYAPLKNKTGENSIESIEKLLNSRENERKT